MNCTPIQDSSYASDKPVVPRPCAVQIVLWMVVTMLATGLSLHQRGSFQLGTYGDDASYAVLARSIVHADAYGLMNEPDRPAATRYPFGYPLLLSPFVWMFPDDPAAGRGLSLLAALSSSACLFWLWPWFSRGTSFWFGLAVSALTLLAPMSIGQSGKIMSEPVFTLCCIALIVLTEQAASGCHWRGWSLAAGSVALLAAFTRTIGVVPVMTCAAYVAWRGRRVGMALVGRAAAVAFALLCLIVVATPVEWSDLIPIEYVDQITDFGANQSATTIGLLGARLLKNVKTILMANLLQVTLPIGGGESARAFFSQMSLAWLPPVMNFGVAAMISVGWVLWIARTGLSAGALVGLIYLLVIPIFPRPLVRYLHPVLPQIFLAMLLGAGLGARLVCWSRPRLATVAGWWVPAITTACLLTASVYKDAVRDDTRSHVGDLELRSEWIRSHTGSEVIVMTEQGQTDFLYGRRHTVPYPGPSFGGIIWKYLQDRRVDFILLGPDLIWQPSYAPVHSPGTKRILAEIAPLIADGRIVEVHTSRGGWVRVLAIRPDPRSAPVGESP